MIRTPHGLAPGSSRPAPRKEHAIALTLRQCSRATFSAVHNGASALIRVDTGLKRVQTGRGGFEIPPGALAVMAPLTAMTIENIPGAEAPYSAQLLVIPETLAHSVRAEVGEGDPLRATRQPRILAAFDRAVAFARDAQVPARLKSHAVREVLLWLGEEGIGFGRPRLATPSDRLRGLIGAEPDRAWRADEAARALAISEPTLRRHLAAEGTSFTAVLADVRMGLALTLLQSSDLAVNRIALDLGYACPSRFAVRFRKRFGLSPRAIRTGAAPV